VLQVKVEHVLKQQIEKSPLEISVNSLLGSGTVPSGNKIKFKI